MRSCRFLSISLTDKSTLRVLFEKTYPACCLQKWLFPARNVAHSCREETLYKQPRATFALCTTKAARARSLAIATHSHVRLNKRMTKALTLLLSTIRRDVFAVSSLFSVAMEIPLHYLNKNPCPKVKVAVITTLMTDLGDYAR